MLLDDNWQHHDPCGFYVTYGNLGPKPSVVQKPPGWWCVVLCWRCVWLTLHDGGQDVRGDVERVAVPQHGQGGGAHHTQQLLGVPDHRGVTIIIIITIIIISLFIIIIIIMTLRSWMVLWSLTVFSICWLWKLCCNENLFLFFKAVV